MIHKFALPVALAAGVLMAGSSAEARDGCGLGFHRTIYGWCRPNVGDRSYVYVSGYPRFGYRWHAGYRYGWHRRFAWHGGHRWGGFRHAGWHGGRHGGWHHRW